MVGEQIELPISDKMLNDKVILKKKKFVTFQKAKHIPTIPHSHFIPKYLLKKNEILCPYKDLSANVHSRLICNI